MCENRPCLLLHHAHVLRAQVKISTIIGLLIITTIIIMIIITMTVVLVVIIMIITILIMLAILIILTMLTIYSLLHHAHVLRALAGEEDRHRQGLGTRAPKSKIINK